MGLSYYESTNPPICPYKSCVPIRFNCMRVFLQLYLLRTRCWALWRLIDLKVSEGLSLPTVAYCLILSSSSENKWPQRLLLRCPQRRHLGNYTKYRRRCERALSDPRAWRRLTNCSVVYALINISAGCSRLRRRGKNHGCRDDASMMMGGCI